jgi:hypothetical protein
VRFTASARTCPVRRIDSDRSGLRTGYQRHADSKTSIDPGCGTTVDACGDGQAHSGSNHMRRFL